jgi:hypothetical protein
MSSALSFDLQGLDRGGGVVGLSCEPRRELDEEALLGDVISTFLETTSVSCGDAMRCIVVSCLV